MFPACLIIPHRSSCELYRTSSTCQHKSVLKFPELKVPYLRNLLTMLRLLVPLGQHRGSSRSGAPEVTLSGFAGGECLPLPGSKGRAFPFLLTLEGCPAPPATSLIAPRSSPKKSGNFKNRFIRPRQDWLQLTSRKRLYIPHHLVLIFMHPHIFLDKKGQNVLIFRSFLLLALFPR